MRWCDFLVLRGSSRNLQNRPNPYLTRKLDEMYFLRFLRFAELLIQDGYWRSSNVALILWPRWMSCPALFRVPRPCLKIDENRKTRPKSSSNVAPKSERRWMSTKDAAQHAILGLQRPWRLSNSALILWPCWMSSPALFRVPRPSFQIDQDVPTASFKIAHLLVFIYI